MNSSIKTPGQQLKAAREELGKSQSEMAKLIRMSVQQLQGLEDDHYESIPAPMYVRGFMKLYAKKVGLNHEPLIELYERMQKGEPLVDEPPVVIPEVSEPNRDALFSSEPETKDEIFEHPEISREASSAPVSFLTSVTESLKNMGEILKDQLVSVNFSWTKSPKVKSAGIAVIFLIMLLFGLRSCGGDKEDQPDAGEGSPVIEAPLLSPPEPVFFQLPSSFQ